ncbi:platelet endothelial cell adhesion molecule isoform X2 [Archocentrus centrarchus]|uniref:platelet endothelial cell adhesion molecule isoform X2 n=1 Tax=Archocentrus centrarchus TaxID=63155 RepID=UPI0011EA2DCE|nr:platelet endothelial cell adhesion molecule-like isoform X2 [Archocentrus centrarchus]
MGSRPPGLLFLTSLLHIWHCVGGQGSYIIDRVGLTVEPRNTVQSGTPVRLRCQVSVSHSNIPHLIHSFQFTQDDVPIYSSNVTKDTVVYEINPARAADSGNYECRVAVKDKSKTSTSQKLDVTGLQIPTLHLDTPSFYENEEFKATCSAPEEKGPLTFRFYKRFRSGKPEIIKHLSPGGNSSTTTLRLSHIGNGFLYCGYEINLVSGTRQSNKSKEIPVLVKALHITPIMNVLPTSNVSEGDLIEVVCKVVNPPRNTEVFLTKDKAILKQAKAGALTHTFTVQEGDSGELVCKAEWGSVQKEASLTITVKELFSKPRLAVKPTDIFEGDRFKVTCSVSIYDPEKIESEAMQFSIYKDNVKVAGADTYMTVARPSANGNYTCRANYASLKHTIMKESQTHTVKAKVAVSEPVLAVEGGTLLLGKPFQLSCYCKRGTLPIEYTLFVPRKPNENKTVRMPGEKAIFNLPPFTERSDLKNILCHARNSQQKPPVIGTGQQLLNSTNIREPVSKPQLTTIPRIGDISEGCNMSLVCSVQRGSPPINFTWYSETKGFLHSRTSSEQKESYSMDNVRGDHSGGYYCVSTNPAGETQQSATIIIGVKMAGWKKGLIAVFCILFILAFIFILFFKKRLPRLKKRGPVALLVKSAGTKVERLSLTQAEYNEANATPGMIGKSIWSEHASVSDSDDNSGTNTSEKPEPQYSEVQLRQADPNKVPEEQDTGTVYSEVRNSQQGVRTLPDGVSVEYAELNHDTDHHSDPNNHGYHGVNDDHTDDNSVSMNSTVNGE